MKPVFKNNNPTTQYLLIVFVILSVFIKFFQISYRSFSLDELYSVSAALEPNIKVAFNNWIAYDSNPPLYYLFLRFWLKMLPATEFWVRLPSVIFVLLASCLFVIGIKRRFINQTWRYLLLLLGANFGFLYFAQEARAYALLFLFTCLQLLFFIDLLALKKFQRFWTKLIPYIVVSVLSCYTHYTGIIFTGILFIALIIVYYNEIKKLKQITIAIITCILLGSFWFKYTLFLFQIDTSFIIKQSIKIYFEIVSMLLFGYTIVGKYTSIFFLIGIIFFTFHFLINFRNIKLVSKVLSSIAILSLVLIAFSPIIPFFYQYRHYLILIPIILLFFSMVMSNYHFGNAVFNLMIGLSILIVLSQGATFYKSNREEWRQAVSYIVTSNQSKKSKVIILAEPWEKSHQSYLKLNPGYLNISIRRLTFYKYYFDRLDKNHQFELIVLRPENKVIENYINNSISKGEQFYILSHAGEFDDKVKKINLNTDISCKETRFYLHEVYQYSK